MGSSPCPTGKPAENIGDILSLAGRSLAEFSPGEQDCISRKVKILVDEGKPQDQAAAIAISYCAPEKSSKSASAALASGLFCSPLGAEIMALGGRFFRKEIIPADTPYKHPVTGEKLLWSLGDLKRIAAESNRYAQSQAGRIPFPDGHKFGAMDNLGYWPGSFAVEPGSGGKMWLKGTVEAGNDDIAGRLSDGRIKDVSAFIETKVKDSHGKEYSDVISHVCATTYPVVHSAPFEPLALSRDGRQVPIYYPMTPAALDDSATKGLSAKENIPMAKTPEHEEVEKKFEALAKRFGLVKKALGLDDTPEPDEDDEKFGHRMKEMAKKALSGIDFPHKESMKLAQEKAAAAEGRATALAAEKVALEGRVAGLEFDRVVEKATRDIGGIPIAADTVARAKKAFLSGAREDAEWIMGQAIALAKAERAAVAGGRTAPRPGEMHGLLSGSGDGQDGAVALDARKQRVTNAAKMLRATEGPQAVEVREDGLALRMTGEKHWDDLTSN